MSCSICKRFINYQNRHEAWATLEISALSSPGFEAREAGREAGRRARLIICAGCYPMVCETLGIWGPYKAVSKPLGPDPLVSFQTLMETAAFYAKAGLWKQAANLIVGATRILPPNAPPEYRDWASECAEAIEIMQRGKEGRDLLAAFYDDLR